MAKEGYISLHRTLLDNPIFNSEPYTKGQAWVAILMLTNHKEGYITVKNGKMIKIERGECGFSELALSDIFKWSRGKVKRFLILLESEKMIQQKIVENHSIIKILNYDKFQNSTTNDTTNSTTNDTTNGQQTIQQTDINNNDNNDNNDNNEKKLDIYIEEENKNFSKNADPFINPQIDKTFRMYSEYCKNLLSLNGYKSKKLRESLLDFLNDVNYDFEYIKDVFVKANELKTIIDQPIDLQKIINCHERIANDYYKKLKQQPSKQPYQQEQPRKLTPEEELALYNDPNTYRPF